MLAASWPYCVDLSRLPEDGKLKNTDYAVIDGDTFDCAPTPDHTLREAQDPRYRTSLEWGRTQVEQAAQEVIAQIRREWFSGE